MIGWITGTPAELVNHTEFLANNDNRELVRVCSAGIVKVQFNVTMKDLHKVGVYPFKA